MIDLLKRKQLGKQFAITTCLTALLASNTAPLAFAVQYDDTQQPVNNISEVAKPTEESRNVVLRGEVSLAQGKQKVAVSLRDSDIKQVLRMFADKAGLNIVFHKSVEGTITLDLVNVTLDDAFNTIMQMAELTYAIENDTLMVASAAESKKLSFTKQRLQPIPVNYIDASTTAKFLNKNIFSANRPGLSNTEIAVSNPRENEVLIFGTESDYKVAKKVIEQLDKPMRINTYKVNHTTPKEMANLLCDAWFKEKGTEGEELEENSDNEIVVGGGVIACTLDPKDLEQGEMTSFDTQGMKVAYFPAQGTLRLYGGTEKQAKDVEKFIKNADKKQPQALLEISIVELNETFNNTINNSWHIEAGHFRGNLGGKTFSHIYEIKPKPSKVENKIITYAVDWTIENRNARVLANPKILVSSGQKATIDLTSDYVKSVDEEQLQSATTGVTTIGTIQRTYNIEEGNGIKVDLIPFISPDGYVSLNIKPEYAVVDETISEKSQYTGELLLKATLLARRNLELNNARVKDGETLVIGGLIKENETKDVKKVPVLGEIPILGALFRSTDTKKEKNELVIMITPHIIKDSDDLAESVQIDNL